MPKDVAPQPAGSFLRGILDGAAKHIGLTIGATLGAAAVAGALATWAAMKAWIIVEIPSGFVLASTTECRDIKGGGWSNFDAAGGRFIVGAGSHPKNPNVSKSYAAFTTEGALSPTGYEPSTGGEEEHTLTLAEIPAHDHTNGDYKFLLMTDGNDTIGSDRDQSTGEPNLHRIATAKKEGEGKPHNNIPPYIALYYCRKT